MVCDSIFLQFMAVSLNFKVILIKFCKELNNFLLLHCSSSLRDHSTVRNAPRGKGDSEFCYEALWGGWGRGWRRGSQVISLRYAFLWYHWLFLFTSGKVTWAMSTFVICLKICMEKKKPVGPRFYRNLNPA